MRLLALAIAVFWATSATGATNDPACESPWLEGIHNPSAPFAVGYYQHPYTDVIEVLAVTDRFVYVREVRGHACAVQPPLLETVWWDGKFWKAPDCVYTSQAVRWSWVRVPDRCYDASVTVVNERGAITIQGGN